MKRISCFLFLLLFAIPAFADQIRVFSTGTDDGGALLPEGSADPHYLIVQVIVGASSLSTSEPVVEPTGGSLFATDLPAIVTCDTCYPLGTFWVPQGPLSKWISPSVDTNGIGGGVFVYETTFDLTGLDPATARITGSWAQDDYAYMYLNGVPVAELPFGWMFLQLYGLQVAPNNPAFTANHDFVLGDGFAPGINTLRVIVWNAGGGPTGLRVEIASASADPATRQVAIDIRPGDGVNPVNLGSRGKVPVAILSAADFDAVAGTDIASLTFGATGDEASLAFCNTAGEDVNADGLADLVCHFFTQKTGFTAGSTVGILEGKTVPGIPIIGQAPIVIVP